MGYDCTLHLVDERAIEAELVPRLLGKSGKKLLPFEATTRNRQGLAASRKLILEAPPDEAARALTELAIHFASASLPHLVARGCAFSLMDRLPTKIAVSPESMFTALLAVRPQLRRRLPTQFVENFMTGVFIPAKNIPAARAWLSRQADAPAPIERVLAAAEKHGLAYWEATDLEPTNVVSKLLDEPPPAIKTSFTAVKLNHVIGRSGETVFARGANDGLVVIDLAKRKHASFDIDLPTLVTQVEGRWLLVERRQDTTPYRWRLFERRAFSKKAVDAAPKFAGSLGDPVVIGGEIYARNGKVLVQWQKDDFVPVKGIPASDGVVGSVGDILIWAGDGWESKGVVGALPKWKKTFGLKARPSYVDWTAAVRDSASFYYLSNRQVFLAERGKKPKRAAARLSNVMSLAAGPNGECFMSLGDNKERWALAMLHDGAVTGVRAKDLGAKFDTIHGLAWSTPLNALYVFTASGFAVVDQRSIFQKKTAVRRL